MTLPAAVSKLRIPISQLSITTIITKTNKPFLSPVLHPKIQMAKQRTSLWFSKDPSSWGSNMNWWRLSTSCRGCRRGKITSKIVLNKMNLKTLTTKIIIGQKMETTMPTTTIQSIWIKWIGVWMISIELRAEGRMNWIRYRLGISEILSRGLEGICPMVTTFFGWIWGFGRYIWIIKVSDDVIFILGNMYVLIW